MKRVLFVDDEPALLDGLRRRLYRSRSRWDMVFVNSAALALVELEREPCDVIVADMRMAKMDGVQLLQIVSERWPQTIRIVLSGYAEQQQIIRLVPIAHQYLSKPTEAEKLEQVIERCLQLREVLDDPHIRAVVGRVRQLPVIPRIFANLTQVMAREDQTIAEVAQIIGSDSAITAKVLQVVNSAFFRLPKRVTRIEQAVAHLGFSAIRSLALSAEVFCEWPTSGMPPGFDPERLQAHTNQIAAAAYAVAAKAPWADDALLAGLLHDIGYWVLLPQCASEMSQALKIARDTHMPLHLAEREVMGTSHAEIGAYLLGLWGLPYPILEAVAFHHEPQRATQAEYGVLSALAVAHAICDSIATDEFELPGASAPTLDTSYLSSVRAPFDWTEARQRVTSAGKPEYANA